jgi:hypothetical protein
MRDLRDAVFGPHALERMAVRRIAEAAVRAVLEDPESAREVRPGRLVVQGSSPDAEGRPRLLRVFVDVDRNPPRVVTAYRTGKIEKYRRAP